MMWSETFFVDAQQILDLSDEIVRLFKPHRIIVFGSYAYGKPTVDSDVDLLVIMPHKGSPLEQAIKILHKTEPHFPIDLIVRTPKTLRERIALNDFFLMEITEKGIVLHDAADPGVGEKGRRRLRRRLARVAGAQVA